MNTQTVKPELNNPEMKAAYFAQYWGQKVVGYGNKIGGLRNISPEHFNEESYLELTPANQITDNDAIELASAYYGLFGDYEKIDLLLDGKKFALEINMNFTVGCDATAHSYIFLVDQLRLKGYALPWNGHSVEELIEAGYCQLKPIEQNTASNSIEKSIESGELKGGEQDG